MIDGQIPDYHKVMLTDLDGTFFCARAAARYGGGKPGRVPTRTATSLRISYGSFIATASMSGHIVNIPQLQAAYNAAKAGVIHLCKHRLNGSMKITECRS